MTITYEITGDRSVRDLFVELFGVASRGWIFCASQCANDAPIDGESEGELGLSRYDGDAITAEVAGELDRTGTLERPVWCALSIRVPERTVLRRRRVLRRNGVPIVRLECDGAKLRLVFGADGFPLQPPATDDPELRAAFQMMAESAREEIEAISNRLSEAGVCLDRISDSGD